MTFLQCVGYLCALWVIVLLLFAAWFVNRLDDVLSHSEGVGGDSADEDWGQDQ